MSPPLHEPDGTCSFNHTHPFSFFYFSFVLSILSHYYKAVFQKEQKPERFLCPCNILLFCFCNAERNMPLIPSKVQVQMCLTHAKSKLCHIHHTNINMCHSYSVILMYVTLKVLLFPIKSSITALYFLQMQFLML